MSIRGFKPTSAGKRFMTVSTFEEITATKPEKSLTTRLTKKGGRNNNGRVTVRHQGGGSKQLYRLIDFKRDKLNIPGKVVSVEYDPNRSARIALIQYADGEKRYILWPDGLKVGTTIIASPEAEIKVGNALQLKDIPLGSLVHNVELKPGKGGQMVRSAGAFAQVLAKEGRYIDLKMPSGEVRKVLNQCMATIGQVGNLSHSNITIGKAGRQRWLGVRPTVRGVAMNPVDHPHGGGEGRVKGNHPVTPWGLCTKGRKTRKASKQSDKLIVKRRK